ncbi:MMPL family transporter, partial [Myxococcota bacterium]|nr:MMPL family transporter [Myxococcota bacterium]
MKNIATQVIRFRWLVILFFLGATGFFASRLPTVELDPSLKGLLPDDVPSRLNLTKIEEIFGGTDMLMLTLVHDDVLQADTLRRTRTLSRKLERLKGVDRVVSLFTLKDIRSSDGDMVVESAVLKIPATKEEREKLRERLKANDLIYGNVVSKDFKATAIMALLKDNGVDDDVLMASVHSLIAENPGPEEILFAGLPYLRTLVAADMQNDLRRFLPLGILVMLIFLFAAFRQLRGVLLPFVVVLMSIFVGIGVIPLLGWKIQLVTVLLPVMLIAIGNDYGIHIYARYQEENLPGSTLSSKELAAIVFQDLTIPVFLTGLTTMAGMLSLLAHIVVPSQQLGILAAIAIMWALAASLLFIPAVLSLLPVAKPLAHLDKKATKKPFLERVLDATAELVVTKPKGVVAAFALVALLVSFGISLLIVDTNPVNYYPEDAPVHAANDLV